MIYTVRWKKHMVTILEKGKWAPCPGHAPVDRLHFMAVCSCGWRGGCYEWRDVPRRQGHQHAEWAR